MKKYSMIMAISAIVLLTISTSAYSVQACNIIQDPKTNNYNLPFELSSQQIVAAAHWNENFPVQGGWVFAVVGHEPGFNSNAWLYVSGFHPAGIAGPTNTTFSGTNSTVKLQYQNNILFVSATINFTVTKAAASADTAPAVSYALHYVNLNWTIPTTPKPIHSHNSWTPQPDKSTWSDTTATVTINLAGAAEHTDLSTSDWATLGILEPQQTLAVAHWIVDSPKAGGWVFAVAGCEPGRYKDAWLYIAGYHPANAFGSNPATIYEALNTTAVQMKTSGNTINIPTLTMNFTQMTFNTATKPIISYALHDVSVIWTLTTQPKMLNHFCQDNWKNNFYPDDLKPASADISINTRGATEHDVVSTSSWAIAEK